MTGTADDIHMGIAQPFGGTAHHLNQPRIKRHRVEMAYSLDPEPKPQFHSHRRRRAFNFTPHRVQFGLIGAADIHREHHPPRYHVAAVGENLDLPHRAYRPRLVRHGDLVHPFHHSSHAQTCVQPHAHRRAAGMRIAPGQSDFQPPEPLAMGDHANRLAFNFQYRPLFDVQLQHRVHTPRADHLIANPTDPGQFVPKAQTVDIGARIGIVLGVQTGEHARCQHCGGKARAFFIRPVGHHNRVAGFKAQIVHGADHFQPAQNPQHPVIAPAGGLGIQMAAHIHRQSRRIGACTGGKHIAHAINAHGHARSTAPIREQMAASRICIGQGLAVVAASNSGADPGHLIKTVPQPRGIDPLIGPDGWRVCWHGGLSGAAGVLMPLAANLFLTVWSVKRL